MTVKLFAIFITFGIIFALIANYIFVTYSPIKMDKLQEIVEREQIEEDRWDKLDEQIEILVDKDLILENISDEAYLGLCVLCISIFCLFFALHIGLQKLFFRKFYENPSIYDAARRGVLLITGLVLALYLKLYGGDLYTILGIEVMIVLFEVAHQVYLKDWLLDTYGKIRERRGD